MTRGKNFLNFEQHQRELLDKNKTVNYPNKIIPWELFQPELEAIYEKERKRYVVCKPMDVLLMFKPLILQQLDNISDEGFGYPAKDCLSSMEFLNLGLENCVPGTTAA